MKNFVQHGDTLDLINDSGADIVSGGGLLTGHIFGVAATDVASGDTGAFKTEGVFTLPKVAGTAWTQGEVVYWDAVAKQVTALSTDADVKIGYAAAAAASNDTSGNVRLTPGIAG